MESSVKSIIKKTIALIMNVLAILLVTVIIFIILRIIISKILDATKQYEPYAGINSRTTNYEIIDGKLICEENIAIELNKYDNFKYKLLPKISLTDILDLKINANGEEINYLAEDIILDIRWIRF